MLPIVRLFFLPLCVVASYPFDIGSDPSIVDVQIIIASSYPTRVVRMPSSDTDLLVTTPPGFVATMDSSSSPVRTITISSTSQNGQGSQTETEPTDERTYSSTSLTSPNPFILFVLAVLTLRSWSGFFFYFSLMSVAQPQPEIVIAIGPVAFHLLTIQSQGSVQLEPFQQFAFYTSVSVDGDPCPLPCLGVCHLDGVCDCDPTKTPCEYVEPHFPSLDEFRKLPRAPTPEGDSFRPASTVADKVKLWREPMRYCFFGSWGPKDKETVLMGIQEWKKYAYFVMQAVTCDKADIRISLEGFPPCSSFVGTDAKRVSKDQPTVVLNCLVSEPRDERKRLHLVLHEFGHALGLEHEHQSPNSPVRWNMRTIYAVLCQKWRADYDSEEECRDNVDSNYLFQPLGANAFVSSYDAASIMNYDWPAAFTLDGRTQETNFVLSQGDKENAAKLYPAPTPGKSVGAACSNHIECDGANVFCGEGICGGTGSKCEADSDCHVGRQCQSKACKLDNTALKSVGGSCSNAAECSGASVNCGGGVCGGTGAWCQTNSDCAVGRSCQNNVCSAPVSRPVGGICSNSGECSGASVYCAGGICGGTGASCAASSDCSGSRSCQNQKCNSGSSSSTCPGPIECSTLFCTCPSDKIKFVDSNQCASCVDRCTSEANSCTLDTRCKCDNGRMPTASTPGRPCWHCRLICPDSGYCSMAFCECPNDKIKSVVDGCASCVPRCTAETGRCTRDAKCRCDSPQTPVYGRGTNGVDCWHC